MANFDIKQLCEIYIAKFTNGHQWIIFSDFFFVKLDAIFVHTDILFLMNSPSDLSHKVYLANLPGKIEQNLLNLPSSFSTC